jgi:orotate phosphoribosyltransferase
MSEDFLPTFKERAAVLEGHFLLSSGLHSPRYVQCARVLMEPALATRLCAGLAASLREVLPAPPSVVVAPALGGVLVAHEVARAFGVRGLFTERQDGGMVLRRGFALEPGERVVVVEDVITTGGSTRETMQVATAAGGHVVGAAAIVDRSGGRATFDVPFEALLNVDLPTYQPDACPLCAQGLPVVKPGSRQVVA